MGSFFAYNIYSGLLLLLFFPLYKLFMAQEKQIRLNRFVMLTIYALSFALWPLSGIGMCSAIASVEWPTLIDFNAKPFGDAGVSTQSPPSLIPQILLWIYVAGIIVMLAWTLLSISLVIMFIRRGRIIEKDGYFIVVMSDEVAPFSFGKYIVISAADFKDIDRDTVIAHELTHIRLRHYIDLALAQTVCVIQWYNPAAWLMRSELKLLHEYDADAAVIAEGIDSETYQKLLIRKSVGNRFHSIVNSLNYSKLKARIVMLQKENSKGTCRLKVIYLALAPVIAVGFSNIPTVAAELDRLKDTQLIPRDYGDSSLQVKMKTANGVVDVPKNETVWIEVGNAYDNTESGVSVEHAVKVNGKLITKRTLINIKDIESFVQIEPDEKFPGGIWEIKLKE